MSENEVLQDLRSLFDVNLAETRVRVSTSTLTASTTAVSSTKDTFVSKTKKYWTRKCQKRKNEEERGAEVETLDEVEIKRVFRPNYFLALRIDDEEIVRNAKDIQDAILVEEPRLRRALIEPSTFHLTLFVLTLKNEAEVARAAELLDTTDVSIEEPLELQFEELGHFRNQVLFAKPSDKISNVSEAAGCGSVDRLKELQQRLYVHFAASELEIEDNSGFEPHLTLFKLSKDPRLRKMGVKKISPELYANHRPGNFGSQRIVSVQLLSMLKPKDETGYYHCCRQVDLNTLWPRHTEKAVDAVQLSCRDGW